MAKYFSESDIEERRPHGHASTKRCKVAVALAEFRDCFFLFAREKQITSVQQLTTVMRSLGFSPTIVEITKYFNDNEKDGSIDFATFLEVMHEHSEKEKCQQEVTAAFRAHDRSGQGALPAAELFNILTRFGEKLSEAEVKNLFQEANIKPKGRVSYDQMLGVLLTPMPDY